MPLRADGTGRAELGPLVGRSDRRRVARSSASLDLELRHRDGTPHALQPRDRAGRRAARRRPSWPRSRTRSRSSRRARPRRWPARSRRRWTARAIASSTIRGRATRSSGSARRCRRRASRPGPKGAVLFPVLAEGELLGALRFPGEGHDYRDQTIAKGVYTLRYGFQPVNGDHLGVSTYRDYALLVPAAKDKALGGPAPEAARGAECRVGRDQPSGRPDAAGGPGGVEGRAGDGPRRGEEHLGGRRPAEPRGQGRVAARCRSPIQLILVGMAMN